MKTQRDREQDMVQMSLYGTRGAANNWQNEVASEMRKSGFRRGRYNPCLYEHSRWKLQMMVHGDDFVSVGGCEEVKEFEKKLDERFEIETNTIGRGEGESMEGRVLNRVIRATAEGWEYEADQRHAETIVEKMGLQGAKGVSTPAEDERK